jgi:hypothetical protein
MILQSLFIVAFVLTPAQQMLAKFAERVFRRKENNISKKKKREKPSSDII